MLSKSEFYENYKNIDFELSAVIGGVVMLTGYCGERDVICVYVDSTSKSNSDVLFRRHTRHFGECFTSLSEIDVSEAYISNDFGKKNHIYSK